MNKRSGIKTKAKILAAAMKVFSTYGYAGANIRAIAEAAGISIGGVYLYFRNKEDLYTGLMRSQTAEFLGRIEALRKETPTVALRMLVEMYMEIAVTKTRMLSTSIKEYDLEFKQPIRNAFFRSQRRILSDILKQGMLDGSFRTIDCDYTALMILVALRGAILSYLTGDIAKPKKFSKALYEFFLNGIRSNRHA